MTRPLFIFELANNHCGDVEHAESIIDSYARFIDKYSEFDFSIKFQYRDIESFIHHGFINSTDNKHIARFRNTYLNPEEFRKLRVRASGLGFKTICTPFDEVSVDRIVEHGFDIVKIASCSLTDWPLVEKIATVDKPIIASTAGASSDDINNVVTFFQRRNRNVSLMHCVAMYPTPDDCLDLGKITSLKRDYTNVIVGYSGHEHPTNVSAIKTAIGLGALVFERHIDILGRHKINEYTSVVNEVDQWLLSARWAFESLYTKKEEYIENSTLKNLKRAVWAKVPIKRGTKITKDMVYYAIPLIGDGLSTSDLSKYNSLLAKYDIGQDEQLREFNVHIFNTRKIVEPYLKKIQELLQKAGIVIKNGADVELSHHYGVENFEKCGCGIINIVNREYCKKLLVILPRQTHPAHRHIEKEETFHVLSGEIELSLDGETSIHRAGDLIPIERGTIHSFTSLNGAIVEEISTTHINGDSVYEDLNIVNNKDRKTVLSLWGLCNEVK